MRSSERVSNRQRAFACFAEVLRCKWTIAVLDGIARGITRPGRLLQELPGLTAKVLNERIRKLENYGLIRRRVYPEIPPRVEYEFTDKGYEFLELLRPIQQFADRWEE